jgi:uncharacterized protein YraI
MVLKTAIAAGLIAISAAAASANPAEALNELNMRAGPGPQYSIVISMPRGANAQAWNCDGAWCRVSWNGYAGYASERYLDITRYVPTVARAPAPAVAPGYYDYAYAPEYRTTYVERAPTVAVTPGYNDYAYAPEYRTTYVEPALPNPLAFPLLPWNW